MKTLIMRSRFLKRVIVFFAFAGCAATGAPSHQQVTPSSTPPASLPKFGKRNPCPPEPVMCPQMYMPSACTVTFSGKEFSTKGSNACHARAELVAKLCQEKNGSVAIANIRCVAISE